VSSQAFQVPATTAIAAIAAGVPAAGANPAVSSGRRSGSTPTFKSGVTYVALPVSVIDSNGRPVVDLDPSLFRVFEDDAPQAIDRVLLPGEPFTVALLVDTSSSMRLKAEETHAATLAAVKELSRVGALQMASFDRRVLLHSALPDARDRFRPPVVQSPGGRSATRLYDAIDLLLAGPLQAASLRAALVILSDGVDTASRLADAETALRRLGESSVPAYVVRYDTSADNAPATLGRGYDAFIDGARPDMKPRLVPEGAGDPGPVHALAAAFLRQIADISGGRLHAASTLNDIEKTFADIATGLRQQYTVAYYPTNQARDGKYRRIRVEVERPDAKVRARAGYYQAPATDVRRR
jgi:VWFA-related protein